PARGARARLPRPPAAGRPGCRGRLLGGRDARLRVRGEGSRVGAAQTAAVLSIFPVDPYQIDPSIDLSDVRGIPVVLRAGDHDDVVGRLGADAFAAMLGPGDQR